eukprot:TRINITY_DN359_c0_g1_i1.p1 TRINITY_DN359_c0_g1~~TRINITY_DN359_c0_g1_i1.p1  ORF type:complete len:184 (-),score=59.72 TRINITY_DN359_c0_g1_i1:424-975(-)
MGGRFSRVMKRLSSKKERRILMLGLDGAGKTTILYNFSLGQVMTTVPTVGFNVETVKYKKLEFTVWDVGGQDKIRPLWRHYFRNTEGLIFVVDSNDTERFEEAREELHKLLVEEELMGADILVFANKQDLPNSASEEELTEALGLHEIRDRGWYVQPACATQGTGMNDGLDWLATSLCEKKKR